MNSVQNDSVALQGLSWKGLALKGHRVTFYLEKIRQLEQEKWDKQSDIPAIFSIIPSLMSL